MSTSKIIPLTCVNDSGKDVPACCHACGEMLEALTKKDALADGWSFWYDMGWWFCESCGLPEEAEDEEGEETARCYRCFGIYLQKHEWEETGYCSEKCYKWAEEESKEVECVALGCKGSVIHTVGSWCETCINQPDPKGVRVQHGSYVYQKQ